MSNSVFFHIPKTEIDKVKEYVTAIGRDSFGSDTASFIRSIEDLGIKTTYELFIVENCGKVSGFIILSVVGVEAEILQIAVDKKQRKLGLGTFVMESIFKWCVSNGVKNMYLEVRRSNRNAVELYKKTGFEVAGNRKNYYDDPIEDALIMTRRICRGKTGI